MRRVMSSMVLVLGVLAAGCTAPPASSLQWDGLDAKRLQQPPAGKPPGAPGEVQK